MTTRAANIGFLLSGLVSPTTGLPVSGGTVYFYEAGTTTEKYVWADIAKTSAYYSYSLSTAGTAQLYGEGQYKIVVKDSGGSTVATLDNVRIEYPYYGIRTVIATGSQVSQDDFLLVNTTSGAVTINLLTAANWTRPLKVQRIAGTNAVTLNAYGAELIDSDQTMVWNSDAIVEIISDGSNLRSAGTRSVVEDGLGTTYIKLYESSTVQIYASGVHVADLTQLGLYVSGVFQVTSGGVFQVANSAMAFNGSTLGSTFPEIDAVCDPTSGVFDSSGTIYYNSGAITVADSSTIIMSADMGTITAGDCFVANYDIGITKGATAGETTLTLLKGAGDGDVNHVEGSSTSKSFHQINATEYSARDSVFYSANASGTFTLEMDGESAGSDSTVAHHGARLRVIFLRKQ